MRYLLKGIFCFSLLILPTTISFSKTITINDKNFPDTYFQTYIAEKYDENNDGKLSEKERNRVNSVSIGEYSDYQLEYEYPSVETIKGIEFFPNLQSLDVSNNNLITIDVSKNVKLGSLNCKMNELNKLDVSKNTKLEMLNCQQNNLSKLSITNNRKLQFLMCGNNKIKKINLLNNKELQALSVEGNKLKKLNLVRLKKLQSLTCSYNKIKKLNLQQNKKLDILYCTGNRLTFLDLHKNHLLQYLYCQDNQILTGNVKIGRSQLSNSETSTQKKTIKAKKIGKYYYIPLKGINKTNEITNLSTGKITDKGIRLKGKKIPKKITYEYNMFTDGDEKTQVEIRVKK